MTYLLDTCVVSDFARGDAATLARIKATSPVAIAVSSVTVMEVEYGLALDATRSRRLAPILRGLIDAATVLPFTSADASAAAGVRAALRKRGQPIGPYEVLIAGCALARGLVLVTSNAREFSRVSGLRTEDWRD